MRTSPRVLLAAVVAVTAAVPAAAAPAGAASLAARQRALASAQEHVDARLDAARASLASTRARADALRARYAAQADIVAARLRDAYAVPEPTPLAALVSGRLDLAATQADLLAAAQRADAASLASLRLALDEMRAAEADVARRKQALAGQTRLLAARRAAVAVRLGRLAPGTGTPAAPSTPAAPADARTVPGGGLPASVLRSRSLPGDAPVDARTGRPVSLDPPRGPAASIDAGGGVGVAWPSQAYDGPRRLTPVTGVHQARAGYPTAAGALYDPNAMMAVHRTLPLGTRLTLRHGAATVVVAIVDRGPFRTDRDLEISPAAAKMLGISGPVTVIATVPR